MITAKEALEHFDTIKDNSFVAKTPGEDLLWFVKTAIALHDLKAYLTEQAQKEKAGE